MNVKLIVIVVALSVVGCKPKLQNNESVKACFAFDRVVYAGHYDYKRTSQWVLHPEANSCEIVGVNGTAYPCGNCTGVFQAAGVK